MKPTFALLCTGLIISLAFYELGALCHRYISVIPTYAWMIIAVVLVKGTGIMSEELEDAAREWGHFAIHSWTAAALTGIGATLIDLKTILSTITPFYLLTVVLVVAAITLTATFVGKKYGILSDSNPQLRPECAQPIWEVPGTWRYSAARNEWNCFPLHRL